jgi:hypothetical protein
MYKKYLGIMIPFAVVIFSVFIILNQESEAIPDKTFYILDKQYNCKDLHKDIEAYNGFSWDGVLSNDGLLIGDGLSAIYKENCR